MMQLGMHGKTVFVTEIACGFGTSIAMALAKQGANLMLSTARDKERLGRLADEAGKLGAAVHTGTCDFASAAGIDAFVKGGLERFGRLDILVNNLPIIIDRSPALLDISFKQWSQIIDLRFSGSLRLYQAAVHAMSQRGWGRIICLIDLSPFYGSDLASSCVGLGVMGLTRAAARDGGASGITANCIGIGGIPDPSCPEDVKWKTEKTDFVPHPGSPDSVVSIISALVSQDAGHVTGQCYMVNGGKYLL